MKEIKNLLQVDRIKKRLPKIEQALREMYSLPEAVVMSDEGFKIDDYEWDSKEGKELLDTDILIVETDTHWDEEHLNCALFILLAAHYKARNLEEIANFVGEKCQLPS